MKKATSSCELGSYPRNLVVAANQPATACSGVAESVAFAAWEIRAVMISAAASAAITGGRLSFTALPPIGETRWLNCASLPSADLRNQLLKVAFLVFEPIMPT